jgi:hypothetical protein
VTADKKVCSPSELWINVYVSCVPEPSHQAAVDEEHFAAGHSMPTHSQIPPGSFTGFLQSYAGDLKGWTTGIIIRYVMAVALLIAAVAGLVGAISVGLAALFHWLEFSFGLNTAYAAVAGLLVLLALVSASVAVLLLRGKLPPIPRPGRQRTKAAGRSLAAKAMLATTSNTGLLKTDPATEIMIGLAAACLVGWLAASRLGGSRERARVK